tara:strand:+ start:176 stop:454 length:279 start_codon:yes stop_codon:yes gene_type:complete
MANILLLFVFPIDVLLQCLRNMSLSSMKTHSHDLAPIGTSRPRGLPESLALVLSWLNYVSRPYCQSTKASQYIINYVPRKTIVEQLSDINDG